MSRQASHICKADYLINLENYPIYNVNELENHILWPKSDKTETDKTILNKFKFQERGVVWSKMLIENIRGKDYLRPPHLITAYPVWDEITKETIGNDLHIFNANPRIPIEERRKNQEPRYSLSDTISKLKTSQSSSPDRSKKFKSTIKDKFLHKPHRKIPPFENPV